MKKGSEDGVGRSIFFHGSFWGIQERVIKRIKRDPILIASSFNPFISFDAKLGVVAIDDDRVNAEFFDALRDNDFRFTVKKVELSPFFFELLFKIFKRFNQELQARISSKAIVLDLVGVENEARNDAFAILQRVNETRVVF
jgi:hypothetical protein